MDEQIGKRFMIQYDGQKYYLYVSQSDLMFSGPGESSILHQERFQGVNLACRLVSKARRAGLDWQSILKQFDSVNVTKGNTIYGQIAIKIREAGYE